MTASPQPTGPYSTAGLSGQGCRHTGPGWITVEAVPGQGEPVRKVYHVRDVYYCAVTTGGAVILSDGRKFSEYLPFGFSKKRLVSFHAGIYILT
jgi:hypothetical protein